MAENEKFEATAMVIDPQQLAKDIAAFALGSSVGITAKEGASDSVDLETKLAAVLVTSQRKLIVLETTRRVFPDRTFVVFAFDPATCSTRECIGVYTNRTGLDALLRHLLS